MTIDGHMKGLEGSHNRVKIDFSIVGTRKMNDEEFEREMVEIEVHLDMLMKLLQRKMEEDWRQGWNVRKKVKWPIVKLYKRKLKHRLDAWIKGEDLKEDGYIKSLEVGPTVHFSEPEQRIILGEEEDANEKLVESFMDSVENPDQHDEEMAPEAS